MTSNELAAILGKLLAVYVHPAVTRCVAPDCSQSLHLTTHRLAVLVAPSAYADQDARYVLWMADRPNSAPPSSGIVGQFPSHVTMTCPFRIASSSALGRREVEPTGETTSRTKTYTTQSDWTFLEVLPCVRPQRSGFLHARVPQAGFSMDLAGSSRACLMSAQRKPRSSRPHASSP